MQQLGGKRSEGDSEMREGLQVGQWAWETGRGSDGTREGLRRRSVRGMRCFWQGVCTCWVSVMFVCCLMKQTRFHFSSFKCLDWPRNSMCFIGITINADIYGWFKNNTPFCFRVGHDWLANYCSGTQKKMKTWHGTIFQLQVKRGWAPSFLKSFLFYFMWESVTLDVLTCGHQSVSAANVCKLGNPKCLISSLFFMHVNIWLYCTDSDSVAEHIHCKHWCVTAATAALLPQVSGVLSSTCRGGLSSTSCDIQELVSLFWVLNINAEKWMQA